MQNIEKSISTRHYFQQLISRLLLVLALYTLLRLGFFIFNRYLFADITLARLVRICKGGIRFDIAALFYTNAPYLLLALLPFPFVHAKSYQRFLKILFVTTNAVAFAVNLVDFAYFRFTLKRTDYSFFQEFAGDVNIGGIWLEAVQQYWILFVVFLLVLGCLVWLYGRWHYPQKPLFNWPFIISRVLAVAFAIALAVIGIRSGIDRTTRPIAISNAGAYVQHPVEAGIVLNTPFCLIRTLSRPPLSRRADFASEAELEAVFTPIHHPDTSLSQTFIPANVVVLILESFSKEHIGALNEGKGYTPFLDSLISCSRVCTHAYANGRKSIDAIPSVLGSLPSFETPFVLTPYALDNVEGMGHLLHRKGYYTAFFHGAPNGSMGFDALSNMLGFPNYFGKNEYDNDADYDGVWGIWDEPFLQYFAKTLDGFSQPFCAGLFTVSSHHPFKVPKQYEGRFPMGTQPVHQCIGYTDNALRLFFARARQSSWFRNTLFVLVADHGQFSPDNPPYQTPLGSMQVPIIYYWPDHIAPTQDPHPAQQIDILPTVMGLLHYDEPYLAFGRDATDPTVEPYVVNYPHEHHIIYQKEEPQKELFLKAFLQQYYNRLIDNRLTP